jgi:hypothetical protein
MLKTIQESQLCNYEVYFTFVSERDLCVSRPVRTASVLLGTDIKQQQNVAGVSFPLISSPAIVLFTSRQQ